MPKQLENFHYHPLWVSHLGCIQGCLKYLGREVSDGWLFGVSGHAFLLNIHPQVCPSGPTAWRKERFLQLLDNLGIAHKSLVAHVSQKNFNERQEHVWQWTRRWIDEGLPCFGWELGVPEYYVIRGYNEAGYLYEGCDGREPGTKPWNELGVSDIGILEVHFVQPADPPDDLAAVRDALYFDLEFSTSPAAWLFPEYRAGVEGFDLWINALRENRALTFGVAYNAAVWEECRRNGAAFLEEAVRRLPGKCDELFLQAAADYRAVAAALAEVKNLHPFPPLGEELDLQTAAATIEPLIQAREAEARGLKKLGEIVNKLAS
ncbi:MAG: hypothetical protein V2A61_04810 [Calditrichota bacterium]